MTPFVVAFAGKRGSGKSTAAAALNGFTDVKFADPLKNMLRALYHTCGLSFEDIERRIEGDLKEVEDHWLNGSTPRWAMQSLGTEWRDLLSTNLWSDIFVKRVMSGTCGDRIVVSDWRFPHETEALDRVGALKIKIDRPSAEKTDAASMHLSETSVDLLKADAVILNTGSVEELKEGVRDMVRLTKLLGETVS